MCKRNFPDKNKASLGSHIKKKPEKASMGYVRKIPHRKQSKHGCVRETPHIKRSQRGMCKETPDIELFLKRCVSSGFLSLFLSLCLAICFVGLFSKAVFGANFGFSCFVFYHFEGSFSLLSAFVGTCSYAFLHLLLIFAFLVASFCSGCFFFFCSLLSRAS